MIKNELLAMAGIALLIAGAFLIVSDGDYNEAMAEHHYYCEMVRSGAWPDYEQRDCEGVINELD